MTKAYSEDLRERVIAAVESGAMRRAAAAQFKVSVSSAIRWVRRWQVDWDRSEAARRQRLTTGGSCGGGGRLGS
jgi:transposase